MSIFTWMRSNKLSTLLLLLLLIFFFNQWKASRQDFSSSVVPAYSEKMGYSEGDSATQQLGRMIMPPSPGGDYAPQVEVSNRLVIQDSYLSLLVTDVRETTTSMLNYVRGAGGYMVNSSLDNPGETPTGTLIVRVPANTLPQTLEYLRGQALKVVSENLTGQDVTDQYVDNEARLATLLATQAKFQSIFDRATEISDITNIQQQMIDLQSQIDAVKGQQQYLEKNAQMAKITIYLSTDELALPYAPQETWYASVIFKHAVRSVVSNFRNVATLLIWVAVYSIIWVPALGLLWYLKKRMR